MVGDGRQLYNDVSLPLFGHNSGKSRAVVTYLMQLNWKGSRCPVLNLLLQNNKKTVTL